MRGPNVWNALYMLLPVEKIPHPTTSHSSCGPAGRQGLMLQEDQGIARQRAIKG